MELPIQIVFPIPAPLIAPLELMLTVSAANILLRAEGRKELVPVSPGNNKVPWLEARCCTADELYQEKSLRSGRVGFRWQIQHLPAAFAALC